MKGCKGSITVFLSLISVLILSLLCTLVEAARVQGVRAWAAAVTDLGIFSVFGEYEYKLLEDYDVFFLDGTYGTGDFCPERMELRIRKFMGENISLPQEGSMNLFPMNLTECTSTAYTLATDQEGQAFYQQVVENQKENLPAELLLQYQKNHAQAEDEEKSGQAYEEKQRENEQELMDLENQKREESEEEGEKEAEEVVEETEKQPVENPLEEIKRIKELGILGLVLKNPEQVSHKEVMLTELPSHRTCRKGTLPVKTEHRGAVADGIFQEYLLNHFADFSQGTKEQTLDYQMEYILMGKESDMENLKAVIHRILWMREGSNFLYAAGNSQMKSQVSSLALAIAGAAPIPGMVPALEAALLLAWAYGESLLDVRTILSGGKIPAVKDETTWKLSLQNLARLTEVLEECDGGGGQGQDYVDYLRILLFLCGKETYPMRALDLMECEQENQKADGWVVKAEFLADWHIPSMFLSVPRIFLGTGDAESDYQVTGCFGY